MKSRLARVARLVLVLGSIACCYGYAAWSPNCSWFGEVIVSGPKSPLAEARIALTFDDGPDPAVTPRILDALESAGVHATFFVVGERARMHPELISRIVADGHSIGNHSFDHPALITLSGSAIEQQIDSTAQAIWNATGRHAAWFRPPFGLRDPRVLARARERGMRTVLWSSSPRDWQEPDAETIESRVLAEAEDGAIVLLHDGDARAGRGRPNTADALPDLLVRLKANGYRCVSLDELFAGEHLSGTAGYAR